MPDLNPESVRAACDAMRAAYRPDCILLRPDAMEAAIHAYLAAEAERGMRMFQTQTLTVTGEMTISNPAPGTYDLGAYVDLGAYIATPEDKP